MTSLELGERGDVGELGDGEMLARIEVFDAEDLWSEISNETRDVVRRVSELAEALGAAPTVAEIRPLLVSVRERAGHIGEVNDALRVVLELTSDPLTRRLFLSHRPFADYARGLTSWMVTTLDALLELTRMLPHPPHWTDVRARVEAARNFHFDELVDAIRHDVAALGMGALANATERLVRATEALEESLERRFG